MSNIERGKTLDDCLEERIKFHFKNMALAIGEAALLNDIVPVGEIKDIQLDPAFEGAFLGSIPFLKDIPLKYQIK